MSLAWQSALRNAALMLVGYVGLELLAVRLGWLHRIGWVEAAVAVIVIGWVSYKRSPNASGVAPPPNDR